MSAVSAGVSEVLIKYTGKYVKIYIIIRITFPGLHWLANQLFPSDKSLEFLVVTH